MIYYLDHIHHEQYMHRCLELAEKGRGFVAPNPMVGAVLVYQNRIIGEGWHQRYGHAHAEVNCIESVSEDNRQYISQSTLFVSLEPCAHFGKTPPCAKLIVENKIPKVVIASVDPNPLVAGKGIQILVDNGIEVICNVCDEEQRNLNVRFYTFHILKRPYVIIKWAQSQDGFIGKVNQRIKISEPKTDVLVHQWRAEEQAILVGTRTVVIDNPQLNARLYTSIQNPIRIALDKNLKIPINSNLYSDSQLTYILNSLDEKKVSANLHFIRLDDFTPEKIADKLYQLGIQSLIIEGGAAVLNEFIRTNLWDEARVIQSEISLEEGIPSPILDNNLELQKQLKNGKDTISFYKNPLQKNHLEIK